MIYCQVLQLLSDPNLSVREAAILCIEVWFILLLLYVITKGLGENDIIEFMLATEKGLFMP
jgi:hypothetical protein